MSGLWFSPAALVALSAPAASPGFLRIDPAAALPARHAVFAVALLRNVTMVPGEVVLLVGGYSTGLCEYQ